MNNLKVGDRVRLVTTGHGYICGEDDDRFFQVGCMGTVTDTNWTDGAIVAMYGFDDPVYFYYDEFELVGEPDVQTSNETPSLVHKTTPKDDDSIERGSQPRVDKNAWFERGELPPIGTICEHEPSGFSNEWFSVEVLAHKEFKGHDTGLLVVFATEDDVSFSSGECFRPIKTAEEMEAEARKKAVGAVEEQILEQMGELNVRNLAEHIVDTFDLRFPNEE